MTDVELEGTLPDPSALPLLMTRDRRVSFIFDAGAGVAGPARLRLHTADQAQSHKPLIIATLNGRAFQTELDTGLGIQNSDPAHLAFPQTVAIDLPRGTLVEVANTLEVSVVNDSWFTWDAIDLITSG